MQEEEYAKMYRLERDYWWFRGKRELINRWVGRYYGKKTGIKILDAGCGTGMIMKMLKVYGETYGLDYSDNALAFCRKRGLKNLKKGSVEKIPYENDYFDAVTVLDVLYHKEVSDDARALKEIYRVLKRGGRIFMTDSAMKCLWSGHDEALHAKRRYGKKDLREKMIAAGFNIEKISYFNTGLFLPVFISRKIRNLLGGRSKSDVKEINPLLNWFLYRYYSFEIGMMRYLDYPCGISIFAVGRK